MAHHSIDIEEIEQLRSQVAELKKDVKSLRQPKIANSNIYYAICILLSCLCLVFAIANERHNAHLEKIAIEIINTYELIEDPQ